MLLILQCKHPQKMYILVCLNCDPWTNTGAQREVQISTSKYIVKNFNAKFFILQCKHSKKVSNLICGNHVLWNNTGAPREVQSLK